MHYTMKNYGFYFKAAIAVMGWTAILLQLFLIILNRTADIPETIVRYFSFFTIESNILVTICFTFLLLKPNSTIGTFFQKPENITAVTLYILIVGIVYNVILRFLWAPTGFQKLADELLHTLIPIFVLVYWYFFAEKSSLKYNHIFRWLLFPTLFLIYTLIRGHFVTYYPYPFLDVGILGYPTVMQNSFFMVFAFLVIGNLLIYIGKKISTEIKEDY